MVGTYKAAAEMVDLYVDLINKYPSIIALIDPFRKEVSMAHLFYFITYILYATK
jgi:enolase